MSLNHVICCDGTNNQFGPENTNVVRLAQVLDRDFVRQRLFYDPGVGTLPEPGVFTRIGRRISELAGLAFGVGLSAKVEEAYCYLMEAWQPGDRVFLFGFSRGAYTVRLLAGLLHALGLLPRGNQNLVPYVMRLYKAIRNRGQDDPDRENSNYWKLCNEFRWSFAREVPGTDQRRFHVDFMGLWDTVSSVGWLWDPVRFPYTAHNPSVRTIRQALAIDERRWFFRQNLMYPIPKWQDVQQHWFAGVHCDVGGGYPDTEQDGGLWRLPFQWLLDEAQKAGLLVNAGRLERVLHHTPHSLRAWDDRQHESLKGAWWLAEYFPKLTWQPKTKTSRPEIGRGRYRVINAGELIDKAALLRMRETDYAPPNISREFRDKVRGLAVVPKALEYTG